MIGTPFRKCEHPRAKARTIYHITPPPGSESRAALFIQIPRDLPDKARLFMNAFASQEIDFN
ncbi:MAG: hypothetical protein SOV63_10565 [Pyramidobacter porci]|nr:hypothetical protein [Pyramidobacter porci]